MDLRFLVQRYLSEGFGRPHPMPRGEKGPRIKGWQNPTVAFGLDAFHEGDNVGTALAGDLVDVDLDCQEAVRIAGHWLAPTERVHGRPSKPRSHYWYRIRGADAVEFLDVPKVDPVTGKKKSAAILEIRCGFSQQTMLPPSIHPDTGEEMYWEDPLGDPGAWEYDPCYRATRFIGTAVLLARAWPTGSRHDAALALGGFLAGRSVDLAEALQVTADVCLLASDDEREDRERAVRESYDSFKANRKTTGLPVLRELCGEDVAKRLGEWYKAADTTVIDGFRLTEAGDADAFAGFGAEVVRHDHRNGSWLIIDRESGIWIKDDVAQLIELMKKFMRFQQMRANDPNEELKQRKKVYEWYLAGESRARINNALQLARSVPPLANSGEDWDTDPFLLGCRNGAVDLRTGHFRPARPEEHVSKRVRAAYDPDATCPLWDATLRDIFAPGPEYDQVEADAILDFFQRAIGYSITADCREECCFIAWGGGGNGKGTLLNTLGWLVGDYRDEMPYTTLEKNQHGSGIPNDVAKMFQKRFITCAEVNEFRLNESRLKALTGRDPITARFLNKEFFTFTPVGKIWISSNNRPRIVGQDDGIWRRINLIPFLRSFIGRENSRLKDQLLDELPGILNWCIRGALLWLERGLDAPRTVKAATEEYRHESSPVTPFVEACCVVGAEFRAQAGPVFQAYERWCNEAHVDVLQRLTDKQFRAAMAARFKCQEARVPGKDTKKSFYFGVGLREDRGANAPTAPEGEKKDLPF